MTLNLDGMQGSELDVVGAKYGVIRLPAEPDDDYRERLSTHIRMLHEREWVLG